jgi:hypothetical protein
MVDETILMPERLTLTHGQTTRHRMALVIQAVPVQSVGYLFMYALCLKLGLRIFFFFTLYVIFLIDTSVINYLDWNMFLKEMPNVLHRYSYNLAQNTMQSTVKS